MKIRVGDPDVFPAAAVECGRSGYSSYRCVLSKGHKTIHVATDGVRVIDVFSRKQLAEVSRELDSVRAGL